MSIMTYNEKDRTVTEEFIGLVVHKYEKNYYDDSDFYAVVYIDGTFKDVMYATTSAYCPVRCEVDAPENLKKKFSKFEEEQRRLRIAKRLLEKRAKLIELSKECRLPNYLAVKRLAKAYGDIDTCGFDSVYKLLKVKKFRSKFRESLAEQVRNWCADKNPKFSSPLSPRQMSYI